MLQKMITGSSGGDGGKVGVCGIQRLSPSGTVTFPTLGRAKSYVMGVTRVNGSNYDITQIITNVNPTTGEILSTGTWQTYKMGGSLTDWYQTSTSNLVINDNSCVYTNGSASSSYDVWLAYTY